MMLRHRIKERLPELLARVEGPFYVYDTERIREICRQFTSLPYQPLAIHFATMANAHPRFLEIVREQGLSLFVNSMGHLDLALQAGFRPEQAVFTASAMDDARMHAVVRAGIEVNLDSLGQVERWRGLFPGRPLGLRCNVGVPRLRELAGAESGPFHPLQKAGAFLGSGSRLGLIPRELRQLRGSLDVHVLHLYVGTDILDVALFEACYRRLLEIIPLFPNLQALDLGGGFGVDWTPESESVFDFVSYGSMVAAFMEQASKVAGRRLGLILEPGRIIGSDAGLFVCRVTDVKRRGRQQLVGVDASSAQFPRPLFYPDTARHPILVLRGQTVISGETRESSVYGCSTYSRDFLARSVALPPLCVGDTVIFGQAGAYCAACSTRFLGFQPAEEVFL